MDFLTGLHMVWKNQESCESWLVVFGLENALKNQKFQLTIFFFFFFWFLSCHYGITNYFEILNFLFSNIKLGGILTH